MKKKSRVLNRRKMMFEKIEIERAENGYIIYVDRGVTKLGGLSPLAPKVFSSERALIKELRSLLKGNGIVLDIGDFKGESVKNK